MLQIYDRALGSGSIPTLVAISILAIGLYLFQGMFDVLRSQILVRIGARVDRQLAPMAHQVAIDMPRFGYSTAEALERGRDVDTVRGFLGSQGPMALFDLPWMPLFLIFVYVLHPMLGALTIGGAFVLTCIAILTEILTRRLSAESHQAVIRRNQVADSNARNAEILKAMGFAGRAVQRFSAVNETHLALQTRTSDISGTLGALSRVLRMMLQSAVLGLAAYLTIMGELSAGAIIAASIASARAMAPIDLAIANWKQVVAGGAGNYSAMKPP
jgi:ATP-binding cassette subfamily C protein